MAKLAPTVFALALLLLVGPALAQQQYQPLVLQLQMDGDLARQLEDIPRYQPYVQQFNWDQAGNTGIPNLTVEDLALGDPSGQNQVTDLLSSNPELENIISDFDWSQTGQVEEKLSTGVLDTWDLPLAGILAQRELLRQSIAELTEPQQARALYLNTLMLDRAKVCLTCLGTVQFPVVMPASFKGLPGGGKLDPATLTGLDLDNYKVSAKSEITMLVQNAITTIRDRAGAHHDVKFRVSENSSIGKAFAVTFRVLIHSLDWRTTNDGWDHFSVTAGYVADPVGANGVLDALVIVSDYERIGGPAGEPSFDSEVDRNITTEVRNDRETLFASQIHGVLSNAIVAATRLASIDNSAAWPVATIKTICP